MSQTGFKVALPSLIEIVPIEHPVSAQLSVPGSKSITNRALILAALADGETVLQGALWSEDTQVMVASLQELGFMVNVQNDLTEPSNRTITIYGKGGTVPRGGTTDQPLELYVGNAGTAARFLTAFVCLGQGVYRLSGLPRMHERPQAALFEALRTLGYRLDSVNNKLPVTIQGAGRQTGSCKVSIDESSQFASALLLCAAQGGWHVDILGDNAEESPYVVLTEKLLTAFPRSGGTVPIEADASSASYFWAADFLSRLSIDSSSAQSGTSARSSGSARTGISIQHWPQSGWQIDERFPAIITGVSVSFTADENRLRFRNPTLSRQTDLGDSIMTAMILAPFASAPVHFTDLGRLRLQECERVSAMRTELNKCGAQVVEQGDTLIISPSACHGAEVETYDDHRLAMCFAILALKIPGIYLRNPACVKKTFPNFFQKLAALPPHGLGALIRSPRSSAALPPSELFAE